MDCREETTDTSKGSAEADTASDATSTKENRTKNINKIKTTGHKLTKEITQHEGDVGIILDLESQYA